MSEEVFSLFKSISKGNSIDIDKERCFQLQIISTLIKNKEMFTKLDELFDDEDDEENLEMKISDKLYFDSFHEMNSDSSEIWYQRKTIEDITSKLYSIDTYQIIDLPRIVFFFFIQFLLTPN